MNSRSMLRKFLITPLFSLVLLASLFSFVVSAFPQESRVAFEGSINGERINLTFDTAATESFIFERVARRLAVAVIPVRPTSNLPSYVTGFTEPVELQFLGHAHSLRLAVIKLPSEVNNDVDGVISWNAFPEAAIIIEPKTKEVRLEKIIPKKCLAWKTFKLRNDTTMLAFRIPDGSASGNTIYVDTGKSDAVGLNPQSWKTFVESYDGGLSSINAYYTPEVGSVFGPIRWASKLDFGGIQLYCVTVEPTPQELVDRLFPNHVATLGMNAFENASIAVDRKNLLVYFQSSQPEACDPPPHNMLGAVFAEETIGGFAYLVARVAEGSPAANYGILDGDILLSINDIDATKWKTDPRVLPINRFWRGEEGNQLRLGMRRKENEFEVNVVLHPLFGNDAK